MSDKKIGALIVFERGSLLGQIIETGTRIDAEPSVEMIENIFFPKAPLHDGAMIIKDRRICAAGCILPLTKKEVVKAKYIFVIMATLLGALIGIIIDVIITFVTQKTMLDIGVLLMTITTSLFGIALVQAVQIPFIYKLRTRKGKNSFDNSFCNFCFVRNWSFWYAENSRWT